MNTNSVKPLFCFTLISLLILSSCRKTFIENLQPEQKELIKISKAETEEFFSYSPTISRQVIRVIDQMRKENDRSGFLSNFLKREGYAIWDKALVKEDLQNRPYYSNDSNAISVKQVLIPLAYKDSNFVHAALACKVTKDSVYISLLDSRYYKLYNPSVNNALKGRKLSLLLMMLDKEVFGHDLFCIKDSSAFESKRSNVKMVKLLNKKDLVTPADKTTRSKLVGYTVEVCYTIFVPVNQGQLFGCPPNAPCAQYTEQQTCDYYTGWYEDGSGGGSTGIQSTGGSASSGGVGGGYTTPPSPCNTPVPRKAARAPNDPCPDVPGYLPVLTTYILTAKDTRIFDVIRREDEQANLVWSKDCQGTNRTGNIQWPGVLEHWLIMIDYVLKNPISGQVEYQIPQSSLSGNKGYADIVNTFSREVFEIKPNNTAGIAAGQSEVARYITKANLFCGVGSSIPWTPGANYPYRLIPNPKNPSQYIEAKLSSSGVITYDYKPRITTPQPVVIPRNIIEQLGRLVEKLTQSMADYQVIIAQFLNQNPELVNYIKSASFTVAVGIIVGTIVEDFLTAGVGIADDWTCFWMAIKIVQFASKL